MHLHPSDTKEAYRPSDKHKIHHLWFHLNYDRWYRKDKKYQKKILETPPIAKQLIEETKKADKQRQHAMADLNETTYVRLLEAGSATPLIPGLGSAHVNEASLTIHPIYGIPYIPATSLKGIVRNWFIQAYCNGIENNLAEHEEGRKIFGDQKIRGVIQFHDLLLFEQLSIEKDVMTTHFSRYYKKEKPATDNQPTIPVSFLRVKVSKCHIYLTMNKKHDEKLIEFAVAWTAKALEELGIGSKTALGYGFFESIHDVTDTTLKEIIKEKEEEREKLRHDQLREKELVAEKLKQKQEAERVAAMTEEERLIYQLQTLTESSKDQEKSKTELYEAVIHIQNVQAAEMLRDYWKRIGQWKVKKQRAKQYEKVQNVKKLLN